MINSLLIFYNFTLLYKYSTEISKEADETEINQQFYFPPELMEKIIYYLDGKTLLQFKLLSKSCYSIVNNVIRFQKLWKKICMNEIPKRYFIDLLSKYFVTLHSSDFLLNIHYEQLYKTWLKWQCTDFKVECIGEENFVGSQEINSIICRKSEVLVIFSNYTCLLTLKENVETKNYVIINGGMQHRLPNRIVILNPQRYHPYDMQQNPYISCRRNTLNECPLHTDGEKLHNGNHNLNGRLIDVDFNIHASLCCWVRDGWFEWNSDKKSGVNITCGHRCKHLYNTMFTSVVHGIIIGRMHRNDIIFHNIYDNVCQTVRPWLDNKYTGATAVYIYTNILFIGTHTGYLLAYRLKSWADLEKPNKTNMLFEKKLDIGQIVKLDVMNFDNFKAIIVSTASSVLWIKLN